MKVTIDEYQAVAEWKWDLVDTSDVQCGICRVEFEGACPKCMYPGDECPITVGECTHCFHMHCVNEWLQAEHSQGRCPMCRQVYRAKVAKPKTATNPGTPSAAGPGGSHGGNDRNGTAGGSASISTH